jgi:hypothetical protein
MMYERQAKLKSDQNDLQRSVHGFGLKLKKYIYYTVVPFKISPTHATAHRFPDNKI